jgi:hypothetical protein
MMSPFLIDSRRIYLGTAESDGRANVLHVKMNAKKMIVGETVNGR